MSVDAVERFYAILAVAAIALMVIVWGARLTRLIAPSAFPASSGMERVLHERSLGSAWIVATLATAGSLYFSEVAGFVPCTLCWYQRIAMYPLVVVLGVGALRGDRSAPAATALAAIGAAISAYHVALEWIPSPDSGACAVDAPCTFVWFRAFGIFSLPTLALTAFLLILTLLASRAPARAEDLERSPA
jgi:disulfide bond formation protein DsbB